MAKEHTVTALTLPAKLVDSTYQSLEDGDFKPLQDVGNYFDDLLFIPEFTKSLKFLKDENVNMPIEQRQELQPDLVRQMPNVPEDDAYDITDGMTGLLSFVRLGWRKGAAAERAKIKEMLLSGELTAEEL